MIGQVFIFILAGLVFILILAYGYKAITGFLERGEEVQLLDFRNALESTVNTIKRDYGSVQRVDLRLPAKTTRVFFVTGKDTVVAGDWEVEFRDRYPLLYNAWDAGNENVFLIPRQPTPLLVPDLLVEDGVLCLNAVNNKVSVRVEGTGSKAKLSAWDNEQACD